MRLIEAVHSYKSVSDHHVRDAFILMGDAYYQLLIINY